MSSFWENWAAVLIDFDGTLADTSHLVSERETSRRTQSWSDFNTIVRLAPEIRGTDETGASALLGQLSDAGVPWAIVSNSPEGSVRAWLDFRGIDCRVVVGSAGKPAATGVVSALHQLGVAGIDIRRSLLIDDGFEGALAGRRAGVSVASVVSTADINEPPDLFLSALASQSLEAGCYRLIGDGIDLGCDAVLEYEVVGQLALAAGRYRKSGDHELSSAIRASKGLGELGGWPRELILARDNLLNAASESLSGDFVVTWIPPHRGRPDRIGSLLADIQVGEPRELLTLTREAARQRSLSYEQRLRNMDGSIAARPVRAPVVVFDDVSTSGATLREAVRALLAAEVPKVVTAAIAKTSYRRPGGAARWRRISRHQQVAFDIVYHRSTANFAVFSSDGRADLLVVYMCAAQFESAGSPPQLSVVLAADGDGSGWRRLTRAERQPRSVKYDETQESHSGRPTFVLVPPSVVSHFGDPATLAMRIV